MDKGSIENLKRQQRIDAVCADLSDQGTWLGTSGVERFHFNWRRWTVAGT